MLYTGIPLFSYHSLVSRTFETLSLGDSDHIDDFIAVKHLLNVDGFLKVLPSPVHLVGYATTVHLDLHDVGTLLMKTLDHAQLWEDRERSSFGKTSMLAVTALE